MLEIIGLTAGILSASAYPPYIRDVLKKTTHPERASWLIWTTLTTIAFASQLAKGASNSLWLPGLETLGLSTVLLLSIRYGVGGLTKKDITALTVAGIGLILWYCTKEPSVALFISIGIDSIGTILTFQKAYKEPKSETASTYFLVALAGLLTMISVGRMSIILLSYPLYIFLANASIPLAMALGKRSK